MLARHKTLFIGLAVLTLMAPLLDTGSAAGQESTPVIALEGSSQAFPQQVRVADLRDSSFTVSWQTTTAVTGTIHYGASADNLNQIAYDDRDRDVGLAQTQSHVHRVTLLGLTPLTTIHYQIHSGDYVGVVFSRETAPGLPPPGSPNIAYGPVVLANGVTPVAEALVYLRILDADGQGSLGRSGYASCLIKPGDHGFWNITLSDVRTTTGDAYFTYTILSDQLSIEAWAVPYGRETLVGTPIVIAPTAVPTITLPLLRIYLPLTFRAFSP